jgi:hypothetical protein
VLFEGAGPGGYGACGGAPGLLNSCRCVVDQLTSKHPRQQPASVRFVCCGAPESSTNTGWAGLSNWFFFLFSSCYYFCQPVFCPRPNCAHTVWMSARWMQKPTLVVGVSDRPTLFLLWCALRDPAGFDSGWGPYQANIADFPDWRDCLSKAPQQDAFTISKRRMAIPSG